MGAGLMMVCAVIGCLLSAVGGIMFLVVAFRESVLWGVAILFIPFANLVFLVKYWEAAKKAFLIQVLGMLIFFAGIAISFALGARSFIKLGPQMLSKPARVDAGTEQAAEPSERYDERAEPEVEPSVAAAMAADLMGKTLKEVKRTLGAPKGVLTANGKVTYFYDGVEFVSEDGVTVTGERVPAD